MSISWCGNRFLSLLRVHICFTCVFLGYLRIDSWMLVCVCVYVCLHVQCHLLRAVEVRVKSALWFVQDFCPIVWGLLLMGFFFIEWGISIVKCNVTRPGLGREGGVTVTGLVTGLSFILYKEEGLFQGSSVLRFLRSSYADSLRVLLAGPTAGVKQLRGVIQLCYIVL